MTTTSQSLTKRLLLWGLLSLTLGGCAPSSEPTLYQVSTLQALMQGAYEGQVACSELPKHGNLGIGTFDALDGEMIVLDGQVYQCTSDGKVITNPATTTPFANVVQFRPDGVKATVCNNVGQHFTVIRETMAASIDKPASMQQLVALLDSKVGSKNLFYAVRIDGVFSTMKVRSVPRQSPPYPPLAQAVAGQRVFELPKQGAQDVRGTIVGFRFPDYAGGVNMPGWHLHFISSDRTSGGHVLDLSCAQANVHLQTVRRFEMVLPTSGTFVSADLSKDMSKEIHAVEK